MNTKEQNSRKTSSKSSTTGEGVTALRHHRKKDLDSCLWSSAHPMSPCHENAWTAERCRVSGQPRSSRAPQMRSFSLPDSNTKARAAVRKQTAPYRPKQPKLSNCLPLLTLLKRSGWCLGKLVPDTPVTHNGGAHELRNTKVIQKASDICAL